MSNIYHDLTDHFNALQNYLGTPGKIINGEGFYIIHGELVPDKEYWEHNSRPTYQPPIKENSDKTNIAPETIKRKCR